MMIQKANMGEFLWSQHMSSSSLGVHRGFQGDVGVADAVFPKPGIMAYFRKIIPK
jgi:hypothetical protein